MINKKQAQKHYKKFNEIENEITNLAMVEHPNVTKLHFSVKSENNLYLFLEYCEHGDLTSFVKARSRFPNSEPRLSEREARFVMI